MGRSSQFFVAFKRHPRMMSPIIVATASSWYLCGLSWTIGVVVYPSFARVGVDQWRGFHAEHTRTITWAVGPMWVIQALSIGWWLLDPPPNTFTLAIVAAVLAGIAVLVTTLLAVPAHNKLSARYDPAVGKLLLRSHHARTVAWTAGAVVCVVGLLAVP